MDNWEVQLQPCAHKNLNKLESKHYDEMQDDDFVVINKQKPPST